LPAPSAVRGHAPARQACRPARSVSQARTTPGRGSPCPAPPARPAHTPLRSGPPRVRLASTVWQARSRPAQATPRARPA
jgi:hypothetical protein